MVDSHKHCKQEASSEPSLDSKGTEEPSLTGHNVTKTYICIAPEKRGCQENIFLISPQKKNIHCGYSLEAPLFLWKNKKNINNFLLKKAPYLELCLWTCETSEDSNQPVHSHCLIRIITGTFWIPKDTKFLHADYEDTDQTVQAHLSLCCAHMSIATDKVLFFYPKNADIFLVSQQKHMLWVLIRSALVRRF